MKRNAQTWPAFCCFPHKMRFAASSTSVLSASINTGDLPPSSSETGVTFLAAAAATTRPMRPLPVKKIWSHLRSKRAVVSGTAPLTIRYADASRYFGNKSARSCAQAGLNSEGLTIAVQPAAMAPIKGSIAVTYGIDWGQ